MSQIPSASMSAAEAVLRDDGGARAATLRAVALLIALTVCLITLGHQSVARADGCVNAELRAQNNSNGLPDCRAYEMVSPSYKEGFTVYQQSFSDDGVMAFTSPGSFAEGGIGAVDNQYIATRSASGWTTAAPNAPTGIYATEWNVGAEALSADLRWALWRSTRRVAPIDETQYFYLTGPGGSITRVGAAGGALPPVWATSADLSHIVFTYSIAVGEPLFEFVGTGHTSPARPVSVDNNGHQPAGACVRAMSADGRVIFFESGCGSQLWARVAGSATVAVSRSQCTRPADDSAGPCSGVSSASYAGSAVDGSRVFFTTTQQLVNGDTDMTSDLYACDIPDGAPAPVGDANSCTTLRQVTGGAGSARVQNVAAVSDDGSRVYFTANGVLADNLGTNNAAAVDSAAGCQDSNSCHDNLYLWSSDGAHPAGQITFVTDLAGGGMASPRITPDGRYLVFGTSAALVKDGPGADADGAVDLYRYDAETRGLVRVSTGVTGSGGNTPGLDAANDAGPKRVTSQSAEPRGTMTADGSTIVFETDEALSAQDIDGISDVYAWHDGQVSLISDGRTGGRRAWITPSGRDIFFSTNGRLTASDGDVNTDIYDARVGGGFDLTQPVPCFGDSCQGRASPAPGLPGPSGGSGDRGSEAVVPGFSLGVVSATQRRGLAQTGRVTLSVKTNAPGVVSVSGSVTGLPGAVGAVRKTVAVAGTVRLTVVLSRKARARLAARGRLSVRLVVSHSKVALSRSVTLRLTHTKTKAKAKRGSAVGSSTKRAGATETGARS